MELKVSILSSLINKFFIERKFITNKVLKETKINLHFFEMEPELGVLTPFLTKNNDGDLEFKIKEMVHVLNGMYKAPKIEFGNYFNINEVQLIVNALNGFLYSPELSDKLI